ncbi:MAG: MBOAT family protein, partial [Schwartzia sp.]|nr:MBOAT family protein [Schwartzia sp. (in: firmicutes)]
LGISFYTFLAISYLLDVYHGKIPFEENFLIVALYIGFFPTVVSGPITKAQNLIGQFHEARAIRWENLQIGIQLFIMGCLKKSVLADRIGVLVDDVYGAPLAFDSSTVWLAVIGYSLQLYFDFSGYSDMAIGCARCLGFTLSENFNLPYIAENISEFWKRWHISLSSWFQEYLYIPLGGSRSGLLKTYRNLLVTMLVCGLWHDAAWNFVLWGLIHGCLLCLYHLYASSLGKSVQLPKMLGIGVTYLSVAFCWVFFRGTDMQNITDIFYRLFVWESFGVHQMYVYAWLSIILLIAVSLYSTCRNNRNGLIPNMDIRKPSRFFILWLEIFVLLGLMYTGSNPFVYASF